MLLYGMIAAAVLLTLSAWVAASPPFSLLGCFVSSWAERCHGPLDD
jgi:type IV secretory pathway TrbD component